MKSRAPAAVGAVRDAGLAVIVSYCGWTNMGAGTEEMRAVESEPSAPVSIPAVVVYSIS